MLHLSGMTDLRSDLVARKRAGRLYSLDEVLRIGMGTCQALLALPERADAKEMQAEQIRLRTDGGVELARTQRTEARAEQYVLGAILLEVLRFTDASGSRAGRSKAVWEAVMRALAPDPLARHADLAAFGSALAGGLSAGLTAQRWLEEHEVEARVRSANARAQARLEQMGRQISTELQTLRSLVPRSRDAWRALRKWWSERRASSRPRVLGPRAGLLLVVLALGAGAATTTRFALEPVSEVGAALVDGWSEQLIPAVSSVGSSLHAMIRSLDQTTEDVLLMIRTRIRSSFEEISLSAFAPLALILGALLFLVRSS